VRERERERERERKGWALERIGCREKLILFRPKSKKVKVRVWRESGKKEVDAFSGLIYGGKRD